MRKSFQITITFLFGAIVGAGLTRTNSEAEVFVGELNADFSTAIGIDPPLADEWSRIADIGGLKVWKNSTSEILAVTKDMRAVQLVSHIDDILFVDLYEDGRPRLTSELSSEADRLFVYSNNTEDEVWVYYDEDFDGLADQRLKPGTPNSSQRLVSHQFQ